jgi:hypothetical protein
VRFFRLTDAAKWRAFCEVFTPRLALEKMLLDDAYCLEDGLWRGPGPKEWAVPPY